jgi:hypothetical protein
MQIKKYLSITESGIPIFSTVQYLRTQSDEFYFLSADDGYMSLPVVIKNKLIFRYAVFHSGVIYEGMDIMKEKEFLNSVVDYLKKKEKIDFISPPPSYVLFNSFPDNSINTPFGTYTIDLSRSEEYLWNNMHQKHRNVVRHAMKNGVKIIRSKDDPDLIYKILSRTLERSGMGFSGKDYFDRILKSLDKNIEIFSAYKDDVFQGCAVIPFNEYSAYYLWGGSVDNPELGSMNLLQWEAIRYFKKLGVREYNFVGARIKPAPGSKLEGIQRFKSRFGAEMKTGYLWKMPLNPLKYFLFKLSIMIRNIGRGSTKDIIDQEREKSKKAPIKPI